MFNKDLVDSLGVLLPLIGITYGHENFKLNTSHLGEFEELTERLKRLEIKLDKIIKALEIDKK